MSNSGDERRKINLKERVLSAVIDSLVIISIPTLAGALFYYFTTEPPEERLLGKTLASYGFGLLSLHIVFHIIGFGELFFSSSPGKYILGLEISVKKKYSPFLQQLFRFVLKYSFLLWANWAFLDEHYFNWIDEDFNYIMFFILLGLVFLSWFFIFRESRQTLYDQLSGTAVYKRTNEMEARR